MVYKCINKKSMNISVIGSGRWVVFIGWYLQMK